MSLKICGQCHKEVDCHYNGKLFVCQECEPTSKKELNEIDAEEYNNVLSELNKIIGMNNIKREVSLLSSEVVINDLRRKKGLKVLERSHHMIFKGNPGTGKTSVARIIGKLYKALGILSKGHFIEVSRKDLLSQYIGSATILTKDIMDKAKGGVLFIDEAHSLTRNKDGKDFGTEVIDTLLTYMENYRDDLVVIAAGYSDDMDKFLDSNPGLKSRFVRTFNFEDYNNMELIDILNTYLEEFDYYVTDDAQSEIIGILNKEREKPQFSNARYIRNIIEKSISYQSYRIFESLGNQKELSNDDLKRIEKIDLIF
jgi:stage V sporulation protein K